MQGIKKKDYFYFQIHKLKFLYLAVYIAGLCPLCMDCPYIKSFDLFLVYIEYFWLMGSKMYRHFIWGIVSDDTRKHTTLYSSMMDRPDLRPQPVKVRTRKTRPERNRKDEILDNLVLNISSS